MIEDEVIQVILRNQGSQGYETIYSSKDVEIDTDLLPYLLPRAKTNKKNPNYYFKYPINKDLTLIKLVQDDGVDAYNRFKAKVILFIVPNDVYESVGGLTYFASPLWLETIPMDTNKPLDYETDFESRDDIKQKYRDEFTTSFHEFLLDKLLLYNNVIISLTDTEEYEKQRFFILRSLAYLDYKLPAFFRNQITIKTLANSPETNLANCILINDVKDIPELPQGTILLNYPTMKDQKDLIPRTGSLPRKILEIETAEEREVLTRILIDSKAVAKEELVPSAEYSQLATRFGIKDKHIFNRLFKSLIFH